MIAIPSPLHPAIVHFPIVLILIGSVVAVAAVFLRRWHLPWLAAGMLAAGAAGSVAATWSGEEEGELVAELSPTVEAILDEHEEWGERTRNIAIVAGLLGIAAASTSRFPKVARGLAAATALAAVGASYAVAETGHYGGLLVYHHGVGINTSAGAIEVGGAPPTAKARDSDD